MWSYVGNVYLLQIYSFKKPCAKNVNLSPKCNLKKKENLLWTKILKLGKKKLKKEEIRGNRKNKKEKIKIKIRKK